MRKQFIAVFGVLLATSIGLFLFISIASADSSTSWLTSDLILQKEADTQSLPSTLNGGNINCIKEDDATCSVATSYGTSANGTTRFNGTGFSYPVLSYLDNRPRVMSVPGSGMAISYTTTPPFGFYLNFNYGFPVILTKDWVN